jgi:hypothetical protein
MKVERKDGGTDEYPTAEGYWSKDGELVLFNGGNNTVVACYAAGTWVRVYAYDPGVE